MLELQARKAVLLRFLVPVLLQGLPVAAVQLVQLERCRVVEQKEVLPSEEL